MFGFIARELSGFTIKVVSILNSLKYQKTRELDDKLLGDGFLKIMPLQV